MSLVLTIGNKNYSSWSMRPWVLMRAAGIPFEERRIPLYQADSRARLQAASPTGRVPCLDTADGPVWDSLAIMEWLNETFPAAGLLPAAPRSRALARCVAAEMHSGFFVLRSALPMNIRRDRALPDRPPGLDGELARIEAIFGENAGRHGGRYLFGAFSMADAMFAPVVMRLRSYRVPVSGATRAYMDTLLATPAIRAWMEEAGRETEVIAEIDAMP